MRPRALDKQSTKAQTNDLRRLARKGREMLTFAAIIMLGVFFMGFLEIANAIHLRSSARGAFAVVALQTVAAAAAVLLLLAAYAPEVLR